MIQTRCRGYEGALEFLERGWTVYMPGDPHVHEDAFHVKLKINDLDTIEMHNVKENEIEFFIDK